MELENKDILERSVSEKMCSSGSNGVGEICSPGTADTRGNRRASRAEILILGGFAGLLAGNGVVFLRKVRWISFRR